jgi:hypothetical protein
MLLAAAECMTIIAPGKTLGDVLFEAEHRTFEGSCGLHRKFVDIGSDLARSTGVLGDFVVVGGSVVVGSKGSILPFVHCHTTEERMT